MSRFRKGLSGNPRGRPKRGHSFTDALRAHGTPDELAQLAWKATRDGRLWRIDKKRYSFSESLWVLDMAYWRMKLRAGHKGPDMWQKCRDAHVAAITYDPIENIDLHPFSRKNHPPGWKELQGSARGSISHFAWDIRGGDTIFVGDSVEGKMIGLGHTTARHGQVAYRFDGHSTLAPSGGDPWRHLIDVDWDLTFVAFAYKDRAPQNTVLPLNEDEIREFLEASSRQDHSSHGLNSVETDEALLIEGEYPRYTPAAVRLIRREHVALSNTFRRWMEQVHGVRVVQEHSQIDAAFVHKGLTSLVEFKIAYLGNTKRAIREALGQILEYNLYPQRISHDRWLLILDRRPSGDDLNFIQALRDKFALPLSLGWPAASGFSFDPELDFANLGPAFALTNKPIPRDFRP